MFQDDTISNASIVRQMDEHLDLVTMQRSGCREYFVTTKGLLPLGQGLEKALALVEGEGATVVAVDLFGADSQGIDPARTGPYPATCLTAGAAGLTGLHVWAIRGLPVRTFEQGGRVVGVGFEDEYANWCRLAGVLPGDPQLAPDQQAQQVFESFNALLAEAGMDFSNVVRTWYYNDRITAWYGDFNRVRNQFFRENRVYDGLVPASTGIGSGNIHGTALVAGLLAIKPKGDGVKIVHVASPLQGPAMEYGSSFSRAVEVVFPDHARLFVSGTASIASDGRTVHVDDPRGQVDLTMQVVGRLLHAGVVGWSEVVRSIVYLKRASTKKAFAAYCRGRALASFPAILTENDVCRDDLLFEVECDAIRLTQI